MEKACSNCFSAIDINDHICKYCGYDFSDDSPNSYALTSGTFLKNRYVIGRVIGSGGFGISYLAYDSECEKVIAIKEYYPHGVAVRSDDNLTLEALGSANEELYEKGIQKFLCEGEYIAKFTLSSEIMGIYDVFRENGTAYYVMDFLNGITLKKYTDEYGRISPQQAVYIAEHIIPALNVIHDGGIIHRDVSPDNIVLCRNGNVKLIDFGAARSYSENENGLSVMMKQGFTPLEQYQRNGRQGAWTDIYSLGASLYYSLTLETPEDPMTRMDDDSVFEEQISALPSSLAQILSRCCEIRAKDRYQSASELSAALSDCGIAPEGFDTAKLRHKEMHPPRTELSYLKQSTVQLVKIAGEMIPIDVEELDLSDRELTNAQIENLHHLKKLRKLDVKDNYLVDLSCIRNLTQLREICFNNNNIDNIEFVRDMNELESISGENSNVSDISPLEGKTELRNVFFGDAGVTDISVLKDCKKLVLIGFNEAKIGDINALAEKPLLEQVCLSGCGLRDISPLKNCPSLRDVYVGRNRLADLSPLKGKKLDNLFFDNNLLSEGLETLEGISVKYTVAAEHNGFTKEQARKVTQLIEGGTFYFENKLGDIWQN